MLNVNISEIILTILNFLLLLFVLEKLLFKPLITFMDKRQSRIDAGLAIERKAQEAVEENEHQVDEHIDLARREAEMLLEQSRDELRRIRQELASKIDEERYTRRKLMAEEMEHLEQAEEEELEKEEATLAQLLVNRLMGE